MRHNLIDQDASPIIVTATGAAGAATTINIVANPDQFWALDWLAYSYSATPSGGGLTITIAGTTVFDLSIPAAGEGFISFDAALYREVAGRNAPMVITLAGGGGAVVGKLNIRYR